MTTISHDICELRWPRRNHLHLVISWSLQCCWHRIFVSIVWNRGHIGTHQTSQAFTKYTHPFDRLILGIVCYTGKRRAYFLTHHRGAWTVEMRRNRMVMESARPIFLSTLSLSSDHLAGKPWIPISQATLWSDPDIRGSNPQPIPIAIPDEAISSVCRLQLGLPRKKFSAYAVILAWNTEYITGLPNTLIAGYSFLSWLKGIETDFSLLWCTHACRHRTTFGFGLFFGVFDSFGNYTQYPCILIQVIYFLIYSPELCDNPPHRTTSTGFVCDQGSADHFERHQLLFLIEYKRLLKGYVVSL